MACRATISARNSTRRKRFRRWPPRARKPGPRGRTARRGRRSAPPPARRPRPDLVWNFAEGPIGGRSREARVPAVLEMLDIPYTCSDPLTLAATLDKDCAKRLVAFDGVSTPAWVLFDGDWHAARERLAALPLPGLRQAGLRRLEQRHSFDEHHSRFRPTLESAPRSAHRDLSPDRAGRGVHRWRRADRRRHRQSLRPR